MQEAHAHAPYCPNSITPISWVNSINGKKQFQTFCCCCFVIAVYDIKLNWFECKKELPVVGLEPGTIWWLAVMLTIRLTESWDWRERSYSYQERLSGSRARPGPNRPDWWAAPNSSCWASPWICREPTVVPVKSIVAVAVDADVRMSNSPGYFRFRVRRFRLLSVHGNVAASRTRKVLFFNSTSIRLLITCGFIISVGVPVGVLLRSNLSLLQLWPECSNGWNVYTDSAARWCPFSYAKSVRQWNYQVKTCRHRQ